MRMKWYFPVAALLLVAAKPAFAQQQADAYTQVITKRSQKIVDQLGIQDTAKARTVRDVIVLQYRHLGQVHDSREAAKAALKKEHLAGSVASLRSKQLDTISDLELEKWHRYFIGQLGALLTPAQIVTVKNAMTYNVLNVTYKGYLEMIPSLTAAQKTQIMANLIEAREYAMDGGSSEEKHWWFGKYKGRINNYLSAQGYNLDQERKDWAKRRALAHNK
jgi:hypothetical protein